MQSSTKNNRYKFEVGQKAYIIKEDSMRIVETVVSKRLKRPYRLSDNFYLCEWTCGTRVNTAIHYEKEMFHTFIEAQIRLSQKEETENLTNEKIC